MIRKEKKDMRKRTLKKKDKRAGRAKLQAVLVRPEGGTSKQEDKHSKIEEKKWKHCR